jgi:two-component system LytT family response regulator
VTDRVRVLIVDDEPLARQALRLLLAADPDVEIVGECSGVDGAKTVERVSPELMFLDVQMPEVDGFDLLEQIGVARAPVVVFVTAYSEHALRAFEVHAVDYLLKPVTEERFRTAFDRAKRRLGAAPSGHSAREILVALDTLANPHRHLERLAVRDGEKTVFVSVEDVEWVEALQNYVRLHVGRAAYLLHVPMNTIEAALDPQRFARIHRSHIVNVQRIKQMWSLSHGQYDVELLSGRRVQSGRTYGEKIRRLLSNPF